MIYFSFASLSTWISHRVSTQRMSSQQQSRIVIIKHRTGKKPINRVCRRMRWGRRRRPAWHSPPSRSPDVRTPSPAEPRACRRHGCGDLSTAAARPWRPTACHRRRSWAAAAGGVECWACGTRVGCSAHTQPCWPYCSRSRILLSLHFWSLWVVNESFTYSIVRKKSK